MRYVMSDIHGEYDLFCGMLDTISFGERDTLFICGDVIDKGPHSIKLAKLIAKQRNIRCILGNHEYAFLKRYRAFMEQSPTDFDAVLAGLQQYFPDRERLDWETVDWLEQLPFYIETEEFICVHAGIPVLPDGRLTPLAEVGEETLVYDRRFKDPHLAHTSPPCVFFGHTQTDCISQRPRILAYPRPGRRPPRHIGDLYKVHLDTGAWSNGMLGCFCIDTCRTYYTQKVHRG